MKPKLLTLLLCLTASSVQAQHAARDSALSRTLAAVADSLNKSKPDTVVKIKTDTIIKVKVETVYVVKPPVDTTKPPAGIAILPGQSIQAASDANPGPVTFILKTGTHVRQITKPHDGQTFIGEPGTVLDGQNATTYAFRAWNDAKWVNNVTLKNFKIINYAPPAQNGAIWGGDSQAAAGDGWTLDSLEIYNSKNLAVRIGNHMKVLRSFLHNNGTINIGGGGKGTLIDGVESSFGNNGCPNDPGFESGGSKFAATDSLVVRNSFFHHNCGPGLWLDIDNINYDLYNNRAEDNIREGIVTEISYKGKIHDNQVSRNGFNNSAGTDTFRVPNWLWNAGIGVHAASDVEVYNNTLVENFNGIAAIQQNRGSGKYGPYIVQNLYVHDNTITQKNVQPAGKENSVGGAVQDVGDTAIFKSRNNRWVHNTYYVAGRAKPFSWMNTWRSWTEWQGYGQDLTGIIDASTPIPPPVDTARFDGVAEQPRGIQQYPNPPCVTQTKVATGLQAALDAAQPGTCLLLAPGATFVGNYVLKDKGATTSYVQVFTEGTNYQAGKRVTPTQAVPLAKIQSANYTAAAAANPGAHHYIFRDVEFGTTPAAQAGGMNVLLNMRDQTGGKNPPHDLWFQRVYAHGTSTLDMRRCFWLDSRVSGVVDSWVSDCHSNNSDSQAILFLSGMRSVLVQNNYLEAGHEIVMSGGGDPPDSTMQPSDLIVRRNHISRPVAWKGVWQTKNIMETKNIRRYLIEGNVIENVWPDAQAGFAFVMKSENQDGTAPWTTTSDVTARYNIVRRIGSGWNLSGKGSNPTPNITASRYSIHDNIIDTLGYLGGDGIGVQYLSQITDPVFKNNTIRNGFPGYSNTLSTMDGGGGLAAIRLVWDKNYGGGGQYGFKCAGTGSGLASLNACAPGWVWPAGSVVVGGGCTSYPTGTLCPTVFPAASSTSGADSIRVANLTQGVVVAPGAQRLIAKPSQLKYKWHESPAYCHKAAEHPLRAAKCDVLLKQK